MQDDFDLLQRSFPKVLEQAGEVCHDKPDSFPSGYMVGSSGYVLIDRTWIT